MSTIKGLLSFRFRVTCSMLKKSESATTADESPAESSNKPIDYSKSNPLVSQSSEIAGHCRAKMCSWCRITKSINHDYKSRFKSEQVEINCARILLIKSTNNVCEASDDIESLLCSAAGWWSAIVNIHLAKSIEMSRVLRFRKKGTLNLSAKMTRIFWVVAPLKTRLYYDRRIKCSVRRPIWNERGGAQGNR